MTPKNAMTPTNGGAIHYVPRTALGAAALLVALAAPGYGADDPKKNPTFLTSDRCVGCHNGLYTKTGEDISIGFDWRPGMMANAARDPYWQAGVRREIIDHPQAKTLIEDECSICHMPMARYEAKRAGHEGRIFAHTKFDSGDPGDRLAADGVSCALCHQISSQKLGTKESFIGGFVVSPPESGGGRRAYGPYAVDAGHVRIMRSATSFQPTQAEHIRQAELCATCHTLYTQALDAKGQVAGALAEQVPYQEWLHSAYAKTQSCQHCHMPVVGEKVPIVSVLGVEREDVSRHSFLGGNFFMPRILNRFRDDLSVAATSQELENAVVRTVKHLQGEAARIVVENVELRGNRLEAEVAIENFGGHKLPTAYPSRRVWLHVTVKDGNGRVLFESGAAKPDGSIEGNDNDADGSRYEPHYAEIRESGQVQIYEDIMGDAAGAVTTGLLKGVRYLKDNRLLPRGFDKTTANQDVAVLGEAASDPDFTAGGDRVRYSVRVGESQGPYVVEAELWYQPIGFRWAQNLKQYDAPEPKRFVAYFDQMAPASALMLAKATGSR